MAIRERSQLLNPQQSRDVTRAWQPKKREPSDVSLPPLSLSLSFCPFALSLSKYSPSLRTCESVQTL